MGGGGLAGTPAAEVALVEELLVKGLEKLNFDAAFVFEAAAGLLFAFLLLLLLFLLLLAVAVPPMPLRLNFIARY